MKGATPGVYGVSADANFLTVAEEACGPNVDIVSKYSDMQDALARLASRFINSEIEPIVLIIDAAVPEGLTNAVCTGKYEHALMSILVARDQLPHQTVLDGMRASADNCIALSGLTPNYYANLQSDITGRRNRDSFKTIYNCLEKKNKLTKRAVDRRADERIEKPAQSASKPVFNKDAEIFLPELIKGEYKLAQQFEMNQMKEF